MEFLAEENDCGQTVLRLVSRGSAIIAELLRLSKNIPGVFYGPSYVEDPEQLKYMEILFDFTYLKSPDEYETKINNNVELLDIDEEFMNNHEDILDRFYQLFCGIYKYIADYLEFLDNLDKGFYIQYTLANILLDVDGAQLMCEALFLLGVILLFLDYYIPGPCRERMIISFYRNKGESTLEYIDEICKLCRITGYLPASFNSSSSSSSSASKRPAQYPERYFRRFPIPKEVTSMVIGKLQSDDIYLQESAYPHRDHRSTRLANQASMLYVILYFSPEILYEERSTMREITDRYFNDNFILTVYLGFVVDLSIDWKSYNAAYTALTNTLELSNMKDIIHQKVVETDKCIDELSGYLTEGIMTEQYVLENMENLLNCLRRSNVTVRWIMLHSRMSSILKKDETSQISHNLHGIRQIFDKMISPDKLITLLLQVSQLEFIFKNIFNQLLETKEERWTHCVKETSDRMNELAEYFTGEKPLTRVKRNEDLMKWFESTSKQVTSLDYTDHTKAGRHLKRLLEALVHVEQFDQVDTNLQVKAFLAECRQFLTVMIHTVRVRQEVLGYMEIISDLSYAWEIINDFMNILHTRIKLDPSSVILLRAMFLKFASILDIPLTRVHQCNSGDVQSIAEYYSGELVDYVRRVMEVIPQSVFRILAGIIKLQTNNMKELPVKMEALELKEYSQLNERYKLARATNEVSKYTEGILAMRSTLLGIIEVDPRQILEDGLRKELVYQVSKGYHDILQFKAKGDNTETRADDKEITSIFQDLANLLSAYRLSIEYIQDYIRINGLRIWHEELTRIMSYNVEQECNRYLKKKVYDRASKYQSRAIPIPRFPAPQNDASLSVNFMGRLLHFLLLLTNYETTIYSHQCLCWYNMAGHEVCGILVFTTLHSSIGILGLTGLNRLLSFRIVHTISNILKFWNNTVLPFYPLLDQLSGVLQSTVIPEHGAKLYDTAWKKLEKVIPNLLKATMIIGQATILKSHVTYELSFSSKLDAGLLSSSLKTLDLALMSDIREHYRNPNEHPYLGGLKEGNLVLAEVAKFLENIGESDPYFKIYVTIERPSDIENLTIAFFMLVVSCMTKLKFDIHYGTLIRQGKESLDGYPLIVGLFIIFKQFHPFYLKQFYDYMGQYIKSRIYESALDPTKANGKDALPSDVVNSVAFLLHFTHVAKIPLTDLYNYVPEYICQAFCILS